MMSNILIEKEALDMLRKIENHKDYWKTIIEHIPANAKNNRKEYSYVAFLITWLGDKGTEMKTFKHNGSVSLSTAISKAYSLFKKWVKETT